MTLAMRAAAPGGPEQVRAYDVAVPAPGPGEVTIAVRAAGVNPTDYKGIAVADETALPLPLGYEVAGEVTAVGTGVDRLAAGDAVLAFRIRGGYAEALTVPATDVFPKPAALGWAEAANLLLVGCTAADLLRVVPVTAGQTVLVHGASGAVGVSLLQQLRLLGVAAVGTASEARFDVVRRFGGTPVRYGDGLAERLRAVEPSGFAAAYDLVGTDEAVDVSLGLVPRDRLVTIAAKGRADAEGFLAVGGAMAESKAFRDEVRRRLIDLAAQGRLVVPVAQSYPLADAAAALAFLTQGHPGGKLALVP